MLNFFLRCLQWLAGPKIQPEPFPVKPIETDIPPTSAQVIPSPMPDPNPSQEPIAPMIPSRVISDDLIATLTIWMEARGEILAGKAAVGEVLLNRQKTGHWGKTVAEVCLAPYQFSCWNTQDSNRLAAIVLMTDHPSYQDCVTAWQMAKNGSQNAKGATFYYNPAGVSQTPAWAKSSLLRAIVGNHRFYADG